MDKRTISRLIAVARRTAKAAYAPYSRFKVGAAVMTDKGVFGGCNVENSSFGLTICAERVAVFKAVSEGAQSVKAVAVFAGSRTITPPCGACLQVIYEFGSNPDIILSNGRKTECCRLNDLLPHGFRLRR
jgi:cytidine deaminase